MARLPRNRSLIDLEKDKFDLNDDEEVIVRTTAEGTFSPTGLKVALLVTVQTITSTAAKIPLTALTGRNSMTIKNESSSFTIYIGNSDVNDTTKGWPLEPLDYLNFDITDDIEIYAVTSSGETADAKILELA